MSASQPRPAFGSSTHASYHPRGYGVSEGLKRARRPFIVRNAITGSAIMAFASGVYFYSIHKVKQDDFSDLGDVRAPAAPVQSTAAAAGVSEKPVPAVAQSPAAAVTGPASINTSNAQQDVNRRRLV